MTDKAKQVRDALDKLNNCKSEQENTITVYSYDFVGEDNYYVIFQEALAFYLSALEEREEIKPHLSKRFDNNGKQIEVFYTKNNEVYMRIDQQTFRLHNEEEDDAEYNRAQWLAEQLCVALNRLTRATDAKIEGDV